MPKGFAPVGIFALAQPGMAISVGYSTGTGRQDGRFDLCFQTALVFE